MLTHIQEVEVTTATPTDHKGAGAGVTAAVTFDLFSGVRSADAVS